MLNAAKETTPEPQWSNTQSKLLDLLQDEENRQISRLELCHKAGFTFASPWYTANRHPEFRAAVKALYAEGERHTPNAKAQMRLKGHQWTKTQQTLLDLLQDEENRQLKLSDLFRKAGFANHGYWYRAIEDPLFREALKDLGVEIERRKPDSENQAGTQGAKWGNAHQQLLEVLQVEENRQLSVVELCHKAGFAAKKAWYRAIKHPLFREKVEALGVEIERVGINAKPRETKAEPQWGDIHQALLDLLQVEENRQLSVADLCQKTSFGKSCWYWAIKHPLFREKVEALGVKVERHELSAKGQTRAQSKILEVLQEKDNRELPIAEICRKAGYPDDFWYKALKSEAFVKELEVLGVPIIRREHNENGWTAVQQNLLDVLQEPANRQLSPTELCQKAGYPKCAYWFRALRNPRFVVAVEALGIEIWWNGRNADGFTRAQQRFLAFLQEDPIITAGELCRKAGYTSTSSWTEVLQDSHFVASLETSGFQVERLERRQDGWTWGQERLLAILQNEAYRDLPIVEICRLAGYSKRVWYEALRRAPVLAAIKDLQVRIRRCGPDEHGWTWAQQRLLRVLQDEANRQLSIIELCTEAGYSDLSRWYESLNSKQFVETLQAWGVQIARQKSPFLPHTDVIPSMNLEEDLKQDIWDMRRFKPDHPKHRNPSAYIVDFTWIENPQLREQIKRYFRQRLPQWEAATFAPHLQKLKGVLAHLPADVTVETITRAHIEAILPAVLAQNSDHWAMSSLKATRAMLVSMAASKTWYGPRHLKI